MPDYVSPLRIVVEGTMDEAIVTRLLQASGICQYNIKVAGGKHNILKKLYGYDQAARFGGSWLVVMDLDQDAGCAPQYAGQLLREPADRMALRFAVRASEAWLMADNERMEVFTGIRSDLFPRKPDEEWDPKHSLVNLISAKCRRRALKMDIVPANGSGRKQGPNYVNLLRQFALEHWRPEVAALNSDSLARCIRALEDLKRRSAL